ncbi:hypothetical protein MHYP_G00050380 [Metynnis hypsauchen]
MADLLHDVQRTVDQSLEKEMHKDADVEVEADDMNKLTDAQLDDIKTTFDQALGKDVEIVDPEPIKSWADIADEMEGNINQTVTLRALMNHINTAHNRSPECTSRFTTTSKGAAPHLLSRKWRKPSGDRTAGKAPEDNAGLCTTRNVRMHPRERYFEDFDVPRIQSALEERDKHTGLS